MTHSSKPKRFRPIAGAVIGAFLAGSLVMPATAEARGGGMRVSLVGLDLGDPGAVAALRRRIAVRAGALCDTGGLASLYRQAAARCRDRLIADAEAQLQDRIAAPVRHAARR